MRKPSTVSCNSGPSQEPAFARTGWKGLRSGWSRWTMEIQSITLSRTGTSSYHKGIMKLHYYPETDSFYVDPNSRPSSDSREIADGLVLDFDAAGNVAGLDIDHASEKLDLKTIETTSLPATATKIA